MVANGQGAIGVDGEATLRSLRGFAARCAAGQYGWYRGVHRTSSFVGEVFLFSEANGSWQRVRSAVAQGSEWPGRGLLFSEANGSCLSVVPRQALRQAQGTARRSTMETRETGLYER